MTIKKLVVNVNLPTSKNCQKKTIGGGVRPKFSVSDSLMDSLMDSIFKHLFDKTEPEPKPEPKPEPEPEPEKGAFSFEVS